MQSNVKKIFCIEGIHGVGKTTYLEQVRSDNPDDVVVLGEVFIDGEHHENLPRQGMCNEMRWIVNW